MLWLSMLVNSSTFMVVAPVGANMQEYGRTAPPVRDTH